jgi:uncharacterized protein YcaQ
VSRSSGGAADLSADEARRIALAAQGFADRRPAGRVDRRHLRRVLDRVALVQLDSVNVVVRSHYLPLFSRLGAYPRALLDRAAYEHRDLFEYWGHEASLIPVAHHPLFRWRMARARTWGGMAKVARDRREYVEAVFREVADRGPIAASELDDPGRRRGPWWGWGDGKRALEWLFWLGRLAAAGRRNFERLYDLPERVLPAGVLSAPTPDEPEAHRQLLLMAARATGVATARDLADYFRLGVKDARPRLDELVDSGALVPARVDGWRQPAYLDPAARVPRRVDATALLSPFDSLVWERARTERLFGFRYRIEIFVPAPQRVHGYYVLPFLHRGRMCARVDLKADRKAGVLRVLGAWAEPQTDGEVAPALAAELTALAGWLDLRGVTLEPNGDLAPALRPLLRS